MFGVGDKVVHPMHGGGVIDGIVREKAASGIQEYYVFRMTVGGLVLKIPVVTSHLVGLRAVVDAQGAQELLGAIPGLQADIITNWNQRYRENMQKLKSGDLYEVARVIKCLIIRDRQRGLSNAERKMLHTAKQIMISELVLSMDQEYQVIERQVNAAMAGDKAG